MGICGMALTLGSVPIYRWNKYAVAEIDLPYDDENTVLLLHGDEIADSSQHNQAVTNNGVSVSTAQSKFGKSLYFNGSSALRVDAGADFDFGTGDFTIDCWCYPTKRQEGHFLNGTIAGAIFFGLNSSGLVGLGRRAVAWDNRVATALPLNTWSHVAVSRRNSAVKIFVNGTEMLSASNTTSYGLNGGLACIGDESGSCYFVGYVDELRISNVARWTASFTPPTAPYSVSEIGRGAFIEEVKSRDSDAYPDGGVQDGYYYERVV